MADDSPPDFAWIAACSPAVARESHDVLTAVLREWDLGRDRQTISPYPRDTDDMRDFDLSYDYHTEQAAKRWEVVGMLRDRRVLRSAHRTVRQSSYGAEPGSLVIESDEQTVRRAAELLRERLSPRAPAPPPQPTSEGHGDLRRLFVEEVVRGAGGEAGKRVTKAAWWVMVVAALGIAAALGWLLKFWRH
jgi:hypothetical protein